VKIHFLLKKQIICMPFTYVYSAVLIRKKKHLLKLHLGSGSESETESVIRTCGYNPETVRIKTYGPGALFLLPGRGVGWTGV
jgi:hypothetical protein